VTVVHSWDELPKFRSEEEESEFWATHALGEELLAQFKPMPPEGDDWLPAARPRTKPIAVRFDESTLSRLKTLARHRNKGYQSLLKEFVVERLYEEEKREGLVGRNTDEGKRSAANVRATRRRADSSLTATGMNDGERRRTATNTRLSARIRGGPQRTSANVRGRRV
jgi:hypothetical protein